MSNLGIDGLISGLDTTSIIEAILDIQYRSTITPIESRIKTEETKLTALQSVNAYLLSFQISNSSLTSSSLFKSKTVSSSKDDVATASVSSSASTGSFSIQVNNLAKSDQISSDIFVSSSDELKLEGQFIINGVAIDVSSDDTLSSIATQINAAGAGVKASVIQVSSNQNKLVLGATSNGVGKIEMREVGSSNILSDLGLISSDKTNLTYDRTVNANTQGALSSTFSDTDTFDYTGETFTVMDAGGQNTLTVTLSGAGMTLEDIAAQINQASTNAGANITASVIEDGSDFRLAISSTTGIPQEFTDPDNVLFNLGVLGGIQSAAFDSSTKAVGSLLGLNSTASSTITLQDGDGSESISFAIDLDSDSLKDIVDRINSAATAAGSDITASVITADDVSRIELSSSTGQVNVLGDTENALQTLGIADRSFKNVDQKGENSQFKYNGVTINRSSNLITDLEDGVSISLLSEGSDTTYISVNQDLSNVEDYLQDFVDSYNTLVEYLDEMTYYDSDEEEKGTLFGNSTIRQLKSALAGGISRMVSNLPGTSLSKLNEGTGVNLGKIAITDRKGNSATIDLSSAKTVQDVIDAINNEGTLDITAEINSNGTGINLVDSSGGSGAFIVEDVNGGTTASDLGLRKRIYSDTIAGSQVAETSSMSLSSIGITMNLDGTLSFDTADLETALDENPDLVKNLLQADGIGIGEKMASILSQYTTSSTGIMDTVTEAIQTKIDNYNEQIERYEERATAMETILQKKFTAMETALSESQSISNLLTQQLSSN